MTSPKQWKLPKEQMIYARKASHIAIFPQQDFTPPVAVSSHGDLTNSFGLRGKHRQPIQMPQGKHAQLFLLGYVGGKNGVWPLT